MKFLKAIRLDASDEKVYTAACREGDWLTSGGHVICDIAEQGKFCDGCPCPNSFMALDSHARCTIAEVVPISEATQRELTDRLARFLFNECGAPTLTAAREMAEEEVAYTVDLCATFPDEVWITVQRAPNDEADGFDEKYSVFKRLQIGSHNL